MELESIARKLKLKQIGTFHPATGDKCLICGRPGVEMGIQDDETWLIYPYHWSCIEKHRAKAEPKPEQLGMAL